MWCLRLCYSMAGYWYMPNPLFSLPIIPLIILRGYGYHYHHQVSWCCSCCMLLNTSIYMYKLIQTIPPPISFCLMVCKQRNVFPMTEYGFPVTTVPDKNLDQGSWMRVQKIVWNMIYRSSILPKMGLIENDKWPWANKCKYEVVKLLQIIHTPSISR